MRKLQRLGIQVKLPVLTVSLVLMSVIITDAVAFRHARAALMQAETARLKQTLDTHLRVVAGWVHTVETTTATLARNPFTTTAARGFRKGVTKTIGDGDDPAQVLPTALMAERPDEALRLIAPTYAGMWRRYDPFFQDIATTTDVTGVYIISLDNRVLYSSEYPSVIGTDVHNLAHHGGALAQLSRALSPDDQGKAAPSAYSELRSGVGGQPGEVSVGYPILSETGSPIATLVFDVGLDGLNTAITEAWDLGQTGVAQFGERRPGQGALDVASTVFQDALIHVAAAEAGVQNQPYVFQRAALTALGRDFVLSVGQSEAELTAPIAVMQRALIRDGAIEVLVAAIVAMFFAMSITRPLGRLQRTLARIRNGDADTPVPDVNRADEIGRIARALQSFTKTLRENKRLVEESAFKNAAFEGSSAPLVLVDRDMRIAYANSAFQCLVTDNLEALRAMAIDVRPDGLVGRSMDLFQPDPEHVRGILSVPDRLPYKTEVEFGDRTIAMMFNQRAMRMRLRLVLLSNGKMSQIRANKLQS